MKILQCFIMAGGLLLLATSCKKESAQTPSIHFVFRFDSTQARLNNIGVAEPVPAGHAAQSPRFNTMSAHYLELAPGMLTALGDGAVLYRAPETTAGGPNAIDYSKSFFAGNNEIFLSVPLSSVAAGSYSWLRVSLAYQNYDINFRTLGQNLTGTVASFIGFNTYISSFKVKDSTLAVNDDKAQGFWAFETSAAGFGFVTSGQAPAGATTVPNPLFNTSPIPAGSCVVTGEFASPLVITGSETDDITVIVSLSTNKSFEWVDDGNGIFDLDTGSTDSVRNMGIRGLIPTRQ